MENRWVGSEYDAGRLLLLGESAYSWREEDDIVDPGPSHAENLVRGAISGQRGRFMTMLTRALAKSDHPSTEQAQAAWDRAAFLNYVDGTVGIGARIRPTDEQWYAATQSFRQTLEELRPKTIIVLGRALWSHMPDADIWLTDDVQGYRLSDRSVTMCWAVSHPSSSGGLSWSRLSDLIAFATDRQLPS